MNLRTYSFFNSDTGEFTGRSCGSNLTTSAELDEFLLRNAPQGCKWIEGKFDRRTQRIDIASGEVIACEDASQTLRLREAQRKNALREIAHLEAKQARRVRELLAQNDPQLKAIDDQVAELRTKL